MSGPDNDLGLAEALLDKVGFDSWDRLAEGLSHSQPYLRRGDDERLQEVQAWLAAHVNDPRTPVEAAVANFRRVLDDLRLIFGYDLEPRGDTWWIRKWYHRSLGGSGRPAEVERFETHVLLVRNLVVELTRALNLVILRARNIDPRFRAGQGLATLDTGSHNAPFQAAQYTNRQRKRAQPYPGLCGFPATIESRDLGALGEVREGVRRTPAMFVEWIDVLVERTGAAPSAPPPRWSRWRALLARIRRGRGSVRLGDGGASAGAPTARREHARAENPGWHVLSVIASVVSLLVAPGWLAGAAIGATAGAFAGSWIFRDYGRRSIWLTCMACAAGGAGLLVGTTLAKEEEAAPPIGEQLSGVLDDAAREGRFVVQRRATRLHGEVRAHVLVLRDKLLRDRLGVQTPSRMSDELRIYDEVRGELRLRLRFAAQNPGEVVQQPEGDSPGFLMRLTSVQDVDADGRREVLGNLERNTLATGALPVPVLIVWDPELRRYRNHPLTPRPLSLRRPAGAAGVAYDGYLAPTVIENQHAEERFVGFAVDDFAVVGAPRGPLFMAAVNVRTPVGASQRYQVLGAYLEIGYASVKTNACGGRAIVSIRALAELHDKMRRALLRRDGPCA